MKKKKEKAYAQELKKDNPENEKKNLTLISNLVLFISVVQKFAV